MSATDAIEGQLASVAVACADAESCEESILLGKAWEVVAALPSELRQSVLPGLISEQRLSQLLAIGAHETAAIEMLGSGLGYIASRSPGGNHIATVTGPSGREFTEPAETLALGLLAGLMRLLRSIHSEHAGGSLQRH